MAGASEEFLRLDEAHLEASRQFYWKEHPDIGAALDAAWSLFDTINRAAGQYATDDADQALVIQIGNEVGVHGDALSAIAEAEAPPNGISPIVHSRLRDALDRVYGRRVRGLMVLYCHRQLAWALGALLRRHHTPAMGLVRVQAESAALAYLMSRNPSLARRWFQTGMGKDGKKFFYETQPQVNQVLAQFGLTHTYEVGSSASQHARLFGVVGSFSMRSLEERGRSVQEIRLGFHEGEEEGEHWRFIHPLVLLRAQERVAWLLLEAFPEVDDPLVRGGHFTRFRRSVDVLWQRFANTFPDVRERAMSWGAAATMPST